MFDRLAKMDTGPARPDDRRIYGVAVGQVINNIDSTGLGRVQLQLPWLPGYEPWARVAVLMAGTLRGTYFIPQVGDEVLVAFNHGDIREPYVVGSLWNGTDRPPSLATTDPITKRLIRSPLGHQIEIDDALQSVTITTNTQQKVSLDPAQIEVSTTGGTASIKLDVAGNVTIQGAVSISLKAPNITIEAAALDLKGSASATLNGGLACNIQAATVKIN